MIELCTAFFEARFDDLKFLPRACATQEWANAAPGATCAGPIFGGP